MGKKGNIPRREKSLRGGGRGRWSERIKRLPSPPRGGGRALRWGFLEVKDGPHLARKGLLIREPPGKNIPGESRGQKGSFLIGG